jgi:hypothetical protein
MPCNLRPAGLKKQQFSFIVYRFSPNMMLKDFPELFTNAGTAGLTRYKAFPAQLFKIVAEKLNLSSFTRSFRPLRVINIPLFSDIDFPFVH